MISCSNEPEFNTYYISYNPIENKINFNGHWVDNLDSQGNVLNKIGFRPYVTEGFFLLVTNEKIYDLKVNSDVPYLLQYINNSVYKIKYQNTQWLINNQNTIFTYKLITYKN